MRIYITSRKRTPSSASPSHFHFALERLIELPEGARGYIDSFTCSNEWEVVLAGASQTLYVKWNTAAQQTLVLEPGELSSVTDLASNLTTGLAALSPTRPPVTVTDTGNNRLLFSCPALGVGERFTVFSCETLNSGLSPYTQPPGGWSD